MLRRRALTLLLLAIASAWEQATPRRTAPQLVEHGLLATTAAREGR